jgi:signal transduction histidine kinase
MTRKGLPERAAPGGQCCLLQIDDEEESKPSNSIQLTFSYADRPKYEGQVLVSALLGSSQSRYKRRRREGVPRDRSLATWVWGHTMSKTMIAELARDRSRPITTDLVDQAEARPNASTTSASGNAAGVWAVVLLAGLWGWTVLTVSVPAMSFRIDWAGSATPIEASTAIVVGLAGVLAYVRYSLTGLRAALLLSLAFAVLALNHIVFGIVVMPGSHSLRSQTAEYMWAAGRLVAAGLLLASAWRRPAEHGDEKRSRKVALSTLTVVFVLVGVQLVLLALAGWLPALTSDRAAGTTTTGLVPGITWIGLAIAWLGTALFLLAAVAHLRPTNGSSNSSPWLAPAIVVAAFSHLHYMLYPRVPGDLVSTGDLLLLVFVVLLFLGITWEFRTAYVAGQSRLSEMQRIESSKSDFFSTITHELGQPIATVRGFAVALSRQWPQLDEAERLELVRDIDRESGYLAELGEQAATLANFDAHGFSLLLRVQSAVELAREAADMAGESGDRLKVLIEPPAEEAIIEGDRYRLLQVVRNLLSNAFKYSGPDTPVELRVDATPTTVSLTVLDRGPGISPSDLPLLFRPFSRLQGAHMVSGSGLGLYISKKIVEAHQGELEADTAPGEGSAFRVVLPRSDRLP